MMRQWNKQWMERTGRCVSPYLRAWLVVLCCLLLPGCGLLQAVADKQAVSDFPPILVEDPLPYVTTFAVEPASLSRTDLLALLKSNSQLEQLVDTPPDGRVGLERRIVADRESAQKLLRSQGYYAGVVHETVDWEVRPVRVRLSMEPGQRYRMGATQVVYLDTQGRALPSAPPGAPKNLAEAGLAPESPAQADGVLDAVERLLATLRNEGYPHPRLVRSLYEVDRAQQVLDATLTVDAGTRKRMDGVRVFGAPNVNTAYFERLIPWEQGAWWREQQVEAYRDTLQQTGLFRSVQTEPDIEPAPEGTSPDKPLPVRVTVVEAAPRSVGGGVKYASDVGFGVQGFWEHRNYLGSGERLRLALPLSQERQEFSASFMKPSFLRTDQQLVAEAVLRNEDGDAYTQSAGMAAVGLERRLSPEWWVSARVSGEGGRIDDALRSRESYAMLGLPLGLRRDTSDNLLNPTKGTRLQLSVTPYSGMYDKAFTTLRLRVDASAYLVPWDSTHVVLAGRIAAGSLQGSNSSALPAPIRFYVGGGGSVRGYKYQSLGAEDVHGDPLGGLSFNELSLEARFKLTETIGLVPFVDGGMVYDSSMPRWGKDLYWATGLGLRYFSPIGPVRFDVAVPLRKLQGNDNYQVYISIGQAF